MPIRMTLARLSPAIGLETKGRGRTTDLWLYAVSSFILSEVEERVRRRREEGGS